MRRLQRTAAAAAVLLATGVPLRAAGSGARPGAAPSDTVHCVNLPMLPSGNPAYRPGEKLHYVMHYKWLGIRTDVGEATAQLQALAPEGGRTVYRAVASGKTYRFWDAFFKVREHFESEFYPDVLRPRYFHRDIYEGGYTMKNYYTWNPDHSINARVERCSDPVKDTLLPGKDCTYDIVTLFYFARNIDFSRIPVGVNQPVSFAIDDETFNIYFRYLGREEKKVYSLGRFRTLKFAAKVVAGEVFSGKYEMIIWVSDDANRIPLLFESQIRVGTVSGRLVGYENLMHPVTSKLED